MTVYVMSQTFGISRNDIMNFLRIILPERCVRCSSFLVLPDFNETTALPTGERFRRNKFDRQDWWLPEDGTSGHCCFIGKISPQDGRSTNDSVRANARTIIY